ncbi:MAG: ribosomal protein S18-alanine N-acetyltransferase [Zestosphaera sp.]
MASGATLRCSVRNATPKDIDSITRVERRSFKHPYPKIIFMSALFLHPELFLVVDCDGKVVGYITGFVTSDNYCHIASIAVDPNFRRMGLGSRLIEVFEGRCVGMGVERVRLEVSVLNEEALKLYRKLGYEVVERIPNYYPDSDAYLMSKHLRKSRKPTGTS